MMKIGNYNIMSIECEKFSLDGGAMFGIIPKTIWGKKIKSDDKNRIPMSARSMLIIGSKKKILVDVGIGNKLKKKLVDIYNISSPSMDKHLGDASISREDITDVIITHLHFDHVGGATVYSKDGKIVPAFPNATYYVQEEHFKWAKERNIREKGSFMPDNYMPLYDLGKLKLIDGTGPFMEGIKLISTYGHTVGMQIIKIQNGNKKIMYPVDIIPTLNHISLNHTMSYDIYPMKMLDEKKKIIEEAVEDKWTIFSAHDSNSNAFLLERDETGNISPRSVSI